MPLTITNLGHCGHMTWYILNIPNNIPSWDIVVTSVWYILNILTMFQFGMASVHCPRTYNVLAMYWVSTSPLAPSVRGDFQALQLATTDTTNGEDEVVPMKIGE